MEMNRKAQISLEGMVIFAFMLVIFSIVAIYALNEQIGAAALLQDLGKISIPDEILNKTSKLTDREIMIIRQHPIASVKILEPVGIFNHELKMIKHHLLCKK